MIATSTIRPAACLYGFSSYAHYETARFFR
jgi:hypothetical protein